jgi:hypothetical protein
MTNLNSPILQGGIKNVNFFNGRLLTATDLRDEQAANRQQHRQLGQAAGSGVVYGLEVSRVAAQRVRVTAGLAINSQGQPLMLADDSEINLRAAPHSNGAAPDFFADCEQPLPEKSAEETDVYALVMAPAAGYSGSAPMHTLQDEGRLNGCGKRYAVEGVKFRLVGFNREALADLSAATRTEILALLDAAEPTAAQRSRLRNLLAHLCFGTEALAAFGRQPFQRDGRESAYWRYGALDALRANGRLNPCDVPLALIHLTAAGIQMIDLWAVRRRATAVTPSAIWPAAVADRRAAEAEAIFLQFQAHLEQLLPERSAAPISAPAYFRYLPPAGLLPPTGETNPISPNIFFDGYPVRQAGPLDGGRLQALLRDSYNYPPVDLDQEEAVRLYKRPSGDDAYTLFTTVRLPPLESMADDLRHHNKHLHGWGIVCGLKVSCGPDEIGRQRRHITVGNGYALDCEGNNLSIHGQKVVDVMAAVDRLAQEDRNNPPLRDGNGEVCLTLGLNDEGRPSVGVERYTPEQKDMQSMFKGTLLMDFYEHCIVGLIEAIKTQFTPQPGEEAELVGPTQKRLITFLNLAIQLVKAEYGRYVYLSPQEDEILRDFYFLLRGLLQSTTFCGMFDNARPFPDYPFPEHNIHTIFGKGFHSRLRLHPSGRLACTVGGDNKLHLYNLTAETMVAAVEMPGGEGLIVQDVAFSADGQQLYAIGNIKDRDTILAVAKISSLDKGQLKWRPINIWCSLRLRRLATYQENARMVYAVGDGDQNGLFAIDVGSETPQPELINEFDPAGHLVIHQASGVAYASIRATQNSDDFDRIRTHNLNDGSSQTFNLNATGQHDLLVADSPRDQRAYLFAIVARSGQLTGNGIVQLDAASGQRQTLIDLGEETVVHLGHVPGSDRLLVSLEDSFRLRRVTIAAQSTLDEDYRFPLQISPLSLAAAPEQEHVYALNILSMTITSIPAAYLVAAERNGAEPPPGGQDFLDSLESYRNDIFAAFIDLLGGLLQYLKDCLCDHFLVNCPDCEEVEPIYLACVSIRNNQVHHVCNFSRRKYVKSFPTVGYWLSIVPLAPFIKQAITRFCCAILPDMFGRYNAPGRDGHNVGVSGYQARQGLTFASSGEMAGEIRQMMGGLSLATGMAGDWSTAVLSEAVSSMLAPQQRAAPEIRQQEVTGQPLEQVNKKMAASDITVAGVEKYDPSHGPENLINLSRSPLRLKAGSQVKLYEEDGVVRYAALVEEGAAVRTTETAAAAAPETAELQQRLATQQNQIEQLETELETLRQFREEVRTFMERK